MKEINSSMALGHTSPAVGVMFTEATPPAEAPKTPKSQRGTLS
jgi:hypothetical protein